MTAPQEARYISSRFGGRQAADVLQALFAAELLRPSTRLWLVSPWISDVPVLDNRANSFSTVAPSWSRSRVRLSSVVLRLLEAGTIVHVATRGDEPHNETFIGRMRESASVHPHLHLHLSAELHEKGLLGDEFYLAGSMNITHSGISVNEEALHLTCDPSVIAQRQIAFKARWPE